MVLLNKKIRHIKEIGENKIVVKRYENDKLKYILEILNKRFNRFNDITLQLYNSRGKLLHTWCDDTYYLGLENFDELKNIPARRLWEDFVWEVD